MQGPTGQKKPYTLSRTLKWFVINWPGFGLKYPRGPLRPQPEQGGFSCRERLEGMGILDNPYQYGELKTPALGARGP